MKIPTGLLGNNLCSIKKPVMIYHEVYNELGRRLVLGDVEQWIGSVLKEKLINSEK